jgi:uncharacterized membrane protein YraQ (UPF0718 family)
MVLDSAFLFMIGLVLAGILHLVLNEAIMFRINSGPRWLRVLKAALIGLPLPLCSCSVLPVASRLRNAGMSRGGVVAFLISTPETGVDSLLLTYALTDPIMTVARPIAAWITAMAAGLTEEAVSDTPQESAQRPIPMALAPSTSCCDDADCGCDEPPIDKRQSLVRRIPSGLKYAFTNLLSDLAPYLVIGYVLAGLVGALIGSGHVLPASVTSGVLGYLWGALLGIPLYVCATSSTPLAASLLAVGLSPGAILVFLLVGPATNIASMVVLKKLLGVWATARFVVIVIASAVICGLLVDIIYRASGHPVIFKVGSSVESSRQWYELLAGIILTLLTLYYAGRAWYGTIRARL